jgi:hypothetical protein
MLLDWKLSKCDRELRRVGRGYSSLPEDRTLRFEGGGRVFTLLPCPRSESATFVGLHLRVMYTMPVFAFPLLYTGVYTSPYYSLDRLFCK